MSGPSPPLTRRTFLKSAVALPARPNILFIVADEWRGQALPSAGDPNLIAPHLARLAREGAHCSRTYTCYAVCCPSRAAMLTGKFPQAAGVRGNHRQLPLNQPTISAALKNSGYRTGYIGKWHLDDRESPGFVPPERRRGFDYWAAYNLSHRHYDNVYFGNDPAPIQTTGFEADYQTGLAIDFLEKKSPQPFYLYLSFVAPHSPFTPPARHDIYDPAKLHLRPNVPKEHEPSARKDLAGYYGLCSAVDENIGRLLKALDDRGLAEDTIVVFTSDHGETLGSHGIDAIDLPFEESSRIPLLIRYPRRIRPGTSIRRLISNVDYAPTLLSLCAVKAPQGMQGVNLASLLTHGRGPSANAVFAEGDLGAPGEWRMAVRGFDKVVVDSAFRPTHHFHLQPDPFELHNLVTEPSRPKQRRELVALIRRWVARTQPL